MIDESNNKSKKKMVVGLIIGILSMLVIIIGATYAYFGANTVVNFNTATITYSTGNQTMILLNGTSTTLYLDITEDDMIQSTNNIIYYASKSGKTKKRTEERVGVASLTDRDLGTYRCRYTLTLSHNGTSDLITRFLSETNDEPDYENRSEGQIILTTNGYEYDINDGWPNRITGYVYVDYLTPGEIKVGLKFIDLKDVDQTYLADTNGTISVSIANDGFECESVDRATTYWTYEPGLNTPFITRDIAHKVDDYHNLSTVSTVGYILKMDGFKYDYYDYEFDCEDDLSYIEEYYPNASASCVSTSTSGYMVKYFSDSYEYEEDCDDAVLYDGWWNAECEYNNDTGYWDLYRTNLNTYSTSLTDCEDIIDKGFNSSTDSCVHPSKTYYSLKVDNYEYYNTFNSIADCNDQKDYYEYHEYADTYNCVPKAPYVFVKESTELVEIDDTNNTWKIYNVYDSGYGQESSCLEDLEADPWEDGTTCEVYNGYRLYRGKLFNSAYNTLADCENNTNHFPSIANPYCVKNNATDYIGEFVANDFDTESDCTDYIANGSWGDFTPTCVDAGKSWLLYEIEPITLSSTKAGCEEILAGLGYNEGNARCVHPNFEKYFMFYDDLDGINYDSYLDCKDVLQYLPSSLGARCVEDLRYSMIVDNYIYDYYEDEADCLDEVDYFEDYYPQYENPRCIANTSSDYTIRYYNEWNPSFDIESDCTSYIDGWNFSECIYNSSTSKWDIYSVSTEFILSTLSECEDYLDLWDEPETTTCVHPDFEYYFLYLDNYDDWGNEYSETFCEFESSYYLESENARCVLKNYYAIEYNSLDYPIFSKQSDCELYITMDYYNNQNYQRPICKSLYEEGEIISKSTSEICAIIDNNLLCYAPNNITENGLKNIMSKYMTCYDENSLICTSERFSSGYNTIGINLSTGKRDYETYLAEGSIGCTYSSSVDEIGCWLK